MIFKGVNNMKYKYDFQLYAVDSDSDERGWYSMDLVSYGNTIEELYENAEYFLIDQDGGEIGERRADDYEAHHLLRLAVLEQDPAPIKLLEKVIGTEYGPVTYFELYHTRDGYLGKHYNRHGEEEIEELTQKEAQELMQKEYQSLIKKAK